MSRAIAGPASLIAVALAGRSLGVVLFGVLVLINSCAQLVSGLAKFQSWQLVVQYGGKVLSGGDPAGFRRSVGFALGLDLLGSAAAVLIALALVPLAAERFGIPSRYVGATILYCTLLPTMVPATATGVLRSLDRFDLIAWQGTVAPVARAAMVVVAWAARAPFGAFLAIWYASIAGGALFDWFLAWRELRRRGLVRGIRPTLRSGPLPGAWRFALNVNVNSGLASVSGPLARLLVGALLGPAGAALYRIASAITGAIDKPTDLVAKAFYPEVARMDPSTRTPWRLMARSAASAGLLALIAILLLIAFGKPFIGLVFGPDFRGAYQPLVVLALIPLLGTISFPIPWMLYALDRPQWPALARLGCVLVYLSAIAPLTWAYGLVGAATALIAGEATRVLVMGIMLRYEYRRLRAQPA